jgi:chromosome segregation ATPase
MSVTRVDLNREQEAHAKTREALACASAREAALRDTIKALQGEIMSLKRSAEQARMTAAKVMNDFDAMKAESAARLLQSKSETAKAKTKVASLEKNVDALSLELASAKAALVQTQKALTDSEQKASVLAVKVERAEMEKQTANEQLADLLTSTSKLNAEHSALTLKFNSMNEGQDQILMALRDAQSKERAMKSEIANLKARLAVPK